MVKELVIDRAKWQCKGHEDGCTELLNNAGKMCCLGFYARAIGCSKLKILNVDAPSTLAREYKRIPKGLPARRMSYFWGTPFFDNEPWAGDAMDANDEIEDDAKREAKITEIFAGQGIAVTFVGEYPNG